MEKIREIDRFHPGFMKCVIDLAANCAVGVSYDSNIAKRARRYLKGRRKVVQQNDQLVELEKIMKENGIEKSKLQEVEKFHAGFSDCVMNLITNKTNANLKYGKRMLSRAENFVKNKRYKSGWSEANSFQIMNQLSQEVNYSQPEVHPSITYNAPVYNNCSFGNFPNAKQLTSEECREYVPSGNCSFGSFPNGKPPSSDKHGNYDASPEVSEKSHFGTKVRKEKRSFKSAAELGLEL